MMELHNALLCISRQTGVKEVFNGSRFCDVTVVGHSNTFLSRGNRLQKYYSWETPQYSAITPASSANRTLRLGRDSVIRQGPSGEAGFMTIYMFESARNTQKVP